VRPTTPQEPEVTNFINSLRFGDGDLLRDGTGDHAGGRTLKGRYIVKVGWDDVRGWFAEVRSLKLKSRRMLDRGVLGRHAHRDGPISCVPDCGRPISSCAQLD
jgi:6-phosphofructokinase 1